MKIILILSSIFFTLYSFNDLGLSITYGDFISFLLLVLSIFDFSKGKLKFNIYSKVWFYFLIIMLFSALINQALFDGRFMNIFKTNFISLIYFVLIYSTVSKSKTAEQIKYVFFGLLSLTILFLIKTWPEMQRAWSNSVNNFTHLEVFESSLNLNTWGYILVLFLVFFIYCWVQKIYPKLSIILVILIVIFSIFSFSRTVYSLIGLILFWTLIYVIEINIRKLIFPILIFIFIFSFKENLIFSNFNISDSALDFYNNKSSSYTQDLVDTRFYIINIKPILEIFFNFNFFQLMIGDSVSIQHSFVSHNLIVFGLMGLYFYLKRFLSTIRYCLKKIRNNVNVISSKFILLLLIVILVNDFVTNISNFLPFASYLSSVILGLLFGVFEKKSINYIA